VRLRQILLASALSATLVGPMLAGPLLTGPAHAAMPRHVDYQQWDTPAQLRTGTLDGVRLTKGKLRISRPVGTTRYATQSYGYGHWTSKWTRPGFGLTELVPSWNATTTGDSWVQVQVRGRSEHGQRSSWDTLARWAPGDNTIRRTSLGEQADDLARVATDTWRSNFSLELTSWQLRVTLLRKVGTRGTPFVDSVGAMSSNLPQTQTVRTSRPGVARGITLNVPKYSQMIHSGHYPQYGNGGEAWCSPTSTAMVLGYYGAQPTPEETAWVGSHGDRVVDHVARMTFDHRYDGTGNWPFNTAYAATRTDKAFVTRFASLRGVERFIAAGIPVIVSVTYGAGGLDNSPLPRGTNGHLLVVTGFTGSGDVEVNDPAASSNAGVRRTYDRGQFEDAWLKRGVNGGSGGVGYVIHDAAHPLPERRGATNW
jgi:hypothetical protein